MGQLMTTIAIIGTGNMGAPMALNLKQGGFRVKAYDLVTRKLDALTPHGIEKCDNHQQCVTGVDAVLTMLPSGVEVKDVYHNQVLNAVKPGCLLIDSSTIDLADAQALHATARRRALRMLDAPVSGGTVGAKNGALTFMVGGDPDTLDTARVFFNAMGKSIIHCGTGGMGQAAKMCNNLMLGIQMASVAEGFNLARQCGLSDETLFEVATQSSGNCFALTTFCPIPDLVASAPSSHGFRPGFSTGLMLKDMNLALNAAELSKLDLSTAKEAAKIYDAFAAQGNANKDFSAIYQFVGQIEKP